MLLCCNLVLNENDIGVINLILVDGWNPAVAPVEVGSFSHVYWILYIPGGFLAGFLNHQQVARYVTCLCWSPSIPESQGVGVFLM